MQHRPLSAQVLEGLDARAQIELGLLAARLALAFWQRAYPEKEHRAPLVDALKAVEAFCATGQLGPSAKETAELAYRAVSSCDLPSGDIQRSSGFSVAHIAMAPWLLTTGSSSRHGTTQWSPSTTVNPSIVGRGTSQSWKPRLCRARRSSEVPNPFIERTHNGGAQCPAPSRVVTPLCAAHVKR